MTVDSVEKCVDIACRHIEGALLSQTSTDIVWRWAMAETWFRQAERMVRNGK